MPQIGELSGGISYFKHGYGCAVHFSNGVVDFDFGSNGEFDGFNESRLIGFAGDRLEQYGFSSDESLKNIFDVAANSDDMRNSGYILYYLASTNK